MQVFKLLTGQWPFMPTSGPTWSAEDFHLAHMQEMVGESFELDIVRSGKYFENYFKWDGEECAYYSRSLFPMSILINIQYSRVYDSVRGERYGSVRVTVSLRCI